MKSLVNEDGQTVITLEKGDTAIVFVDMADNFAAIQTSLMCNDPSPTIQEALQKESAACLSVLIMQLLGIKRFMANMVIFRQIIRLKLESGGNDNDIQLLF